MSLKARSHDAQQKLTGQINCEGWLVQRRCQLIDSKAWNCLANCCIGALREISFCTWWNNCPDLRSVTLLLQLSLDRRSSRSSSCFAVVREVILFYFPLLVNVQWRSRWDTMIGRNILTITATRVTPKPGYCRLWLDNCWLKLSRRARAVTLNYVISSQLFISRT